MNPLINKRLKALGNYIAPKAPWLTLGALAITAEVAGTAFQKILEHYLEIGGTPSVLEPDQQIWYATWLTIYVGLLGFFYHQRKKLFTPSIRKQKGVVEEGAPGKYGTLFITLSIVSDGEGIGEGLMPEAYDLTKKNLEQDLQQMKKKGIRWHWQMPLIAINHHLEKVENIIIICSPESLKQVECFASLVSNYISDTNIKLRLLAIKGGSVTLIDILGVESVDEVKGVPFEDFTALTELTKAGIDLLLEEGVKEEDMIFDITGGYKIASIVAITLTFNRAITAQYVTNNYDVKSYDVVYGTANIT